MKHKAMVLADRYQSTFEKTLYFINHKIEIICLGKGTFYSEDVAQCSKWYEIFDMEFSQKTEENPDQTTNPRANFHK